MFCISTIAVLQDRYNRIFWQMIAQIEICLANPIFNIVHKLHFLYYIETRVRIMDSYNEEIIRAIEELCDEILLIPLVKSSQKPRQTVKNMRDQNKEFLKDLEAITQSTKIMDSIREKVFKLDEQLEQLDRILEIIEQKQNQQWKWYHYVALPIWVNVMTVWSCVKDICLGILHLISSYQDILEVSKEIYLQKKQKMLLEKEKCQRQGEMHENAIDRLRVKIDTYIREKGQRYHTLLQQMSYQFDRKKVHVSPSRPKIQSNRLYSSGCNTANSEQE